MRGVFTSLEDELSLFFGAVDCRGLRMLLGYVEDSGVLMVWLVADGGGCIAAAGLECLTERAVGGGGSMAVAVVVEGEAAAAAMTVRMRRVCMCVEQISRVVVVQRRGWRSMSWRGLMETWRKKQLILSVTHGHQVVREYWGKAVERKWSALIAFVSWQADGVSGLMSQMHQVERKRNAYPFYHSWSREFRNTEATRANVGAVSGFLQSTKRMLEKQRIFKKKIKVKRAKERERGKRENSAREQY